MFVWDQWKKGFDAWENVTAKRLETVLKSPLVLTPAASALTLVMKVKAARDRAVADLWGTVGLPTKRDQERMLHALAQLESKLIDLEEKLESLEPARADRERAD